MTQGRRSPLDRPAQSFDVFDTCLVRTYVEPADLTYDCAERVLAARPGGGATAEDVAALALHRIATHRRLLAEVRRDEVRLAEVYEAMGDLAAWGVDADTMHREELALEVASSRAVASLVAQVARARAAGQRVLFLSDMWLPEALVRQLLLDAGVAQEGDVVRVSGEDGRSKWTGRLFEAVLADEGLAPEDLHHRGDNPWSDHAIPRGLGIAATLVTPARLSRYERLALREHGARHVRSRLAGASLSVRLSYDDPPGTLEAAATAIGAGVAGPLLTAFTGWAMEKARQDGVSRLLFVARDGQVMLRVAEALAPPDDSLRLGYLQTSRRSLLLAGLADTRPQALEELLPPPATRSPRRALAAIDIIVEDVCEEAARAGLCPKSWDRPVSEREAAALARLLMMPAVQERVGETARRAREGVLAYLDQEGLIGAHDWALVDVGWNLRQQRVLRQLTGRDDRRPLGYYLGVRPRGAASSGPGPYRAFLLEGYHEPGPASPGALVRAHATTVEALFTSGDHGSVRGYRVAGGRVEVELGPAPDEARRRYAMRLHHAVSRYAAEVAATALLPQLLNEARDHGLAATALFLGVPDGSELAGLHPLRHADDDDDPVVAPVTPALAAGGLVGWARSGSLPKLPWKAGSLAVSRPATRLAVNVFDLSLRPRVRLFRARMDQVLRRR